MGLLSGCVCVCVSRSERDLQDLWRAPGCLRQWTTRPREVWGRFIDPGEHGESPLVSCAQLFFGLASIARLTLRISGSVETVVLCKNPIYSNVQEYYIIFCYKAEMEWKQ